MKKISLLLGIALGFGLAACNEFDLPNPPGQSNPEEPEFISDNLAIAQAAQTLDLKADNEASKLVTLAEVTKLVDFPQAYDLAFEIELSQTPDFAEVITLETELTDSLIQVEPSTLNSAIYNNFTKDPSDLEIYGRIAAYAELGNTKIRLGDTKDFWYGNDYKYLVIPFAPEKIIEESYYLLQRTPGASDWTVTAALPFTHTSDASVYDNPVFQIKIDVPAVGTEWSVLPGSSFDAANLDGIMGVTDPEAMTGLLVAGEDAVAGLISEESPYTIQIDMREMTYKVALAFEYLYVPNTGSSLTPSSSRVKRLTTTNFINYTGTVYMVGAWFLTGQPSLNGVVYTLGADDSNEQTVDPETGVMSGHIVNDAEGQKMTSEKGLYYLDVNLGTFTYTASPISMISVIGAFNGWDLETSVDMTPNNKFEVWTAKDVELPEGSEFKFCVNHAWTLSYGGEYTDLVQNGGNLTAPGVSGPDAKTFKYDIKIDFSKLPYTCTLTKK